MGMVIGVAAGKDGCGKTFFASNLGAILARGGASACLVDLNFGMRGLDLAFGLESEIVYDLSDVFAGEATLRQAEVRPDSLPNLSLYSCSQDIRKELPSQAQVKGLYDALRNAYDIVVVELPGGPARTLPGLLSGLDCAILVVSPDHDALRNAEAVNEIFRAKGISDRRILLNRVHSAFFEARPGIAEEVVDRLRLPLLGILLEDENVYYSGATGVPVVMEESALTDTFRRIALTLVKKEA